MPCERKHIEAIRKIVEWPGPTRPCPVCDDNRNLTRALNEALSACDESPWSSMESAPKDGTEVDLTDGTDRCTDCLWSDKKDAWVYWGPDGWDSFGWVKIDFVPKGWMPLPAAPEVQG